METPQTKTIKRLIPEGSTYYPSNRCILSEWPKMATRGNGKGKKSTCHVCSTQEEYDAYVGAGAPKVEETIEEV